MMMMMLLYRTVLRSAHCVELWRRYITLHIDSPKRRLSLERYCTCLWNRNALCSILLLHARYSVNNNRIGLTFRQGGV